MNVEIGSEAAQFPEKEYVNGIAVAVCTKYLCPNSQQAGQEAVPGRLSLSLCLWRLHV